MKSTKELARELGILRKRTLTKSSADGERKRAKKSNQVFSFLIVIDFESTCWQGERHRTQEIIEFPAVLLNTATGQIESEFHRYVQPQENPVLSDFCKQLTGISQEQVDTATPLFICLRQFSSWLKEMSTTKMLTFGAPDAASKPTAFVTWSDWDLGVCLQYECRRKQLRKPVELNSWIDLRATYRHFYQRKPQGLNGALQELGVSFEGREHSGLDDARNTAYLAWKMICDGCVMQITKSQTEATIGGNMPQLPQKPPSNPAVKSTNKNANTPERHKNTDLQNSCETAVSKIKTPRQSPKNTRSEVQSARTIDEAISDWGVDEIGDDDILRYLATASPSFKNPSTTVQFVVGSSYGPKAAGLALKLYMGVQGQAVRTPTPGKKRGVLHDITNSLSMPVTNSDSGKMPSQSPFTKSSANSRNCKDHISPRNNCRKALCQESGFTKIKSPLAKSSAAKKLTSSSGVLVPAASYDIPENHCKQFRQPDKETTSSGSAAKPVTESVPKQLLRLGRACSVEVGQNGKKLGVKSPAKLPIEPPAEPMATDRKISGEQLPNSTIVKDVPSGRLNGKCSELANGNTSSAASLQNPQTTTKIRTPSAAVVQKPQTTPSSNTFSGVIVQKPSAASTGDTRSGVILQNPRTAPRGNSSSGVTLQMSQTTTPRGITSVRPHAGKAQDFTANEQSFDLLNSCASRAMNVATPSPRASSFFRTPACGSSSLAPSSSMRKTPPMCDCGCRAKRKFVQSPGPNLGKAFFCCGSQRSRSGPGCKFFRWETFSPFSPPLGSNHQTPDGCKTPMSVSSMPQPKFDTASVLTRPLTRPR